MQACEEFFPRKEDGSFYTKTELPAGKWDASVPLQVILCYTLHRLAKEGKAQLVVAAAVVAFAIG